MVRRIGIQLLNGERVLQCVCARSFFSSVWGDQTNDSGLYVRETHIIANWTLIKRKHVGSNRFAVAKLGECLRSNHPL